MAGTEIQTSSTFKFDSRFEYVPRRFCFTASLRQAQWPHSAEVVNLGASIFFTIWTALINFVGCRDTAWAWIAQRVRWSEAPFWCQSWLVPPPETAAGVDTAIMHHTHCLCASWGSLYHKHEAFLNREYTKFGFVYLVWNSTQKSHSSAKVTYGTTV